MIIAQPIHCAPAVRCLCLLICSASYASCGLDEGKFYLFDTRSKITEAAFYIDTRKEDLFTHERYSDFGVLLGYGDGEMKHLDMRQPNKVSANSHIGCTTLCRL